MKNTITLTEFINTVGNLVLKKVEKEERKITACILEGFLDLASDKAEALEKRVRELEAQLENLQS